jgi:hypothetical protein
MPLASSQLSLNSGKRFSRSSTENERKGKIRDDTSIRIIGEPRLSNRRKVPLSLSSTFVLLQIRFQFVA